MKQSTIMWLIALATAVFALWFFNTHEKQSQERWTGFQGEARANDHLAAQMLLQELGFEAESRATLTPSEWLPPTEDTVFIRLTPTMTIGEERMAILNWVSDGGNLILLPPNQTLVDVDEFLMTLGFNLVETDYYEDESSDESAEEDAGGLQATSDYEVTEKPADESSSQDEYDLSHLMSTTRIGLVDGDAEANIILDQDVIVVARREWGQGYVTLIASSFLFDNNNISTGDHARLFADVVAGEIDPGKVWLIYQSSFSPLWEVIWRAAPFLVLSLAALLGLWLWAVMPVFGPRIRPEEESRRSIVEHIRASGVFVWRHDGAESLMESSTHAVLHEAESRHPGIGRLPRKKQAEVIARMTGMSAQKVMDVLNGQPDQRPREFTHSMQRLQSIRKEL